MSATICLSHLLWRPSFNKWDYYQHQGLAWQVSVAFQAHWEVSSNSANTSWWPRQRHSRLEKLWVTASQRKPQHWYSSFFQFIPVSNTVVHNQQGHSGCFHGISDSYLKSVCFNISFTSDNVISVAFGITFWCWVQYLMTNPPENTGGLCKKSIQ